MPHAALGVFASGYNEPSGGTAPGFVGLEDIILTANPGVIFPPFATQTTVQSAANLGLTGTEPITLTAVWKADGVEMVGQNSLTWFGNYFTADLDFDGYYPPGFGFINVELAELRASNGITPDAVGYEVTNFGMTSIQEEE
jgi:hypothetical protein